MLNKKILFISGTRADFGKLKSLMQKVDSSDDFDLHIFVTGMHMLSKYGMTVREVEKSGFKSIYQYINQNSADTMDAVLAKTVLGLTDYVKELKPDMIVVHGDRVEAMAGAIVGSLNNILVSHIEGGEVSGTIDELIRHSVSKMAHLHFVCNENAKQRLLQLGELSSSIHIIGSPDLDIMVSKSLPTLDEVKKRYGIPFDDYAVLMYHPVTTEVDKLPEKITAIVEAVLASKKNFVVIYPNNDHGTDDIIRAYEKFENNEQIKMYPSLRFEHFLVLLKYASFVIGNSSAGVREAPFYGVPSLNLGSRQNNRAKARSIINSGETVREIIDSIQLCENTVFEAAREFGDGKSDEMFYSIISQEKTWKTKHQKVFNEIISG